MSHGKGSGEGFEGQTINKQLYINQEWATSVLEDRCLAEFSSNSN